MSDELAPRLSAAAAFLSINALTGNPLLLQFQQSWGAHFAAAKSFEYGSPADRPFDWSVLLKNWDTTLPALLGLAFLLRPFARKNPTAAPPREASCGPERGHSCPQQASQTTQMINTRPNVTPRQTSDAVFDSSIFPLAWLTLTFIVFPTHQPWWTYYYIHNAIPLCWSAAIGLAFLWTRLRTALRPSRLPLRPSPLALPACLFALCASAWLSARVYLQVTGIRAAPRIYTALILKEIDRFKPFTTCLYTDQPIYSFHSGIPLPPKLGVVSLKRFWTGDLTNARLVAELEAAQPGLILVANDTQERPYQDLLNSSYRVVYRDASNRLYAHRSIAKKAQY